jgi:uncharacterized protein (TIGR02466 family)
MIHIWPEAAELNDELRSRILSHRQSHSGESKSNIGGWHSDAGRLEFCGDAGRRLLRYMYDLTDEATRRVLTEFGQPMRPFRWTLYAWANVNGPGDFNRTHTHPGSTWSGTYYIDTGQPDDAESGTALHLLDPCQGRANMLLPPLVPSSFTQRPEPGMSVVFPSYLPHMVYPHRGGRPRISIAFNARKEPFP